MNYNEILEIISELNWEISEVLEEYYDLIEFASNGDVAMIKFLGIVVWHSEDDERQWIDEKNEYEPLAPFLRKKLNIELNRIKRLKF